MTSHGQYAVEDAGHATGTSPAVPTRLALALLITATLALVDTMPRLTSERSLDSIIRSQQYVPSACGADAVARAQREIESSRARRDTPTAIIPTAIS